MALVLGRRMRQVLSCAKSGRCISTWLGLGGRLRAEGRVRVKVEVRVGVGVRVRVGLPLHLYRALGTSSRSGA